MQHVTDQWSGFGSGSSTIAMTVAGTPTADSMCKVLSGHLQISSGGPVRAQLVLRGYGSEDELISSRPIVASGSTVSIGLRAPAHTAWTANADSNHLAWVRVDTGNSTNTQWAYVVTLKYQKVPNNTLIAASSVTLVEHMRE